MNVRCLLAALTTKTINEWCTKYTGNNCKALHLEIESWKREFDALKTYPACNPSDVPQIFGKADEYFTDFCQQLAKDEKSN
jgi:hypothetical protein